MSNLALAASMSIRTLYPCSSSKYTSSEPFIKLIGLSLTKEWVSRPKSDVVTRIPLLAPSDIIDPYKSRAAETGTTFVYRLACITNLPPLIGSSSKAIASIPLSLLAWVTLTSDEFPENKSSNNSLTKCSNSSQSISAKFVVLFISASISSDSTNRLSCLFNLRRGFTGATLDSGPATTPFSDLIHSLGSNFSKFNAFISSLSAETEIIQLVLLFPVDLST